MYSLRIELRIEKKLKEVHKGSNFTVRIKQGCFVKTKIFYFVSWCVLQYLDKSSGVLGPRMNLIMYTAYERY